MVKAKIAFSGEVVDKCHYLTARVYFADTDFSGVVYHGRYLEFLERGRSEFLRQSGICHRELAKWQNAWVVRRMEIDFLKPALIDDVLIIQTKITKVGGARLTMQQSIICDDVLVVKAKVEAALINAQAQPIRFPKEYLDIWEKLL